MFHHLHNIIMAVAGIASGQIGVYRDCKTGGKSNEPTSTHERPKIGTFSLR